MPNVGAVAGRSYITLGGSEGGVATAVAAPIVRRGEYFSSQENKKRDYHERWGIAGDEARTAAIAGRRGIYRHRGR
jgi:hypothetical protein